MAEDVDHYAVLGLPSGAEGAKLSLDEIKKAYKEQSRVRHPDKRPDDPNATADFQRLKTSFEFLKDDASRAAFDARLRSRRDRLVRDSALDAKRRKLASDLDERERAAADAEANDPAKLSEMREKSAKSRLQAELAAFQARMASSTSSSSSCSKRKEELHEAAAALNEERTLKVSWERGLGDYSAATIEEMFGKFGGVEDVVIRSSKKKGSKGSALVVMDSKEAAIAATHSMSGSLSNPLLVLPLRATSSTASQAYGSAEAAESKVNDVVGASFKNHEASILEKLQKRAAEQKKNMQQSQVS